MPIPKENYTAEEFLGLIPENNTEIYELHNGKVTCLASPNILHQRLSRKLTVAISNFIDPNGGKCEVFTAPTDVRLNDKNVVVPDIFVACNPDNFDKQKYNGAPDFIIEIVSSNRADDFIKKLSPYQECGVREYWIVDPEMNRTVVYFFEKNRFPEIYMFDSSVPVNIYGGKLRLNIAELLQ